MASRAQAIYAKYSAWDTVNNVPKTGDVSNHTLKWVKDGTASTPSNSPSEVANGVYQVLLTSTEATCNDGMIEGSSSTSGVYLFGVAYTFEQLPTTAAGLNGGLPTADASNQVKANLTASANGVLDVACYTAAALAAFGQRGYINVDTGTASPDPTGMYINYGFNNGATMYRQWSVGASNWGSYYISRQGTDKWLISTVPSTESGAWWITGSGTSETGDAGGYTAGGTATGVPVVTFEGAAKLSAHQPNNPGLTLAATQTGVTIPTVTNLTNAPTAGDLTATMKTSVTTAATAATPTLNGTQSFNNTGQTTNLPSLVNAFSDTATQAIASALYRGKNIYFVRTDGSNSNTGKQNSSGGAFLTFAHAASTATSGDVVIGSKGTFAEGSNRLPWADGVSVIGAGPNETIITSTFVNGANASWKLASNARVSSLTFDTTGTPTALPVGRCAADGNVTNAEIENVILKGDSDVFQFQASGTHTVRTRNSEIWSKGDCFVSSGGGSSTTLHEFIDCQFHVFGPDGDTDTNARVLVISDNTKVRAINCYFEANGGGSAVNVAAIAVLISTASVDLIDCAIETSGGSTTLYDIKNANGGSVTVCNTSYSTAKVSGVQPTVIAPQMDLINAPNATALSAIAAAIWAAGTRTLSSFGTLVADTATAVWAATVRTLSAFGFTVDTTANSTEIAIKAQTDLIAAAAAAAAAAQTAAEGLPDATAIATAVGTQITSDHGSGAYTGSGGGATGSGIYAVNQDGGTGSAGALVQIAAPYTASLADCSAGCMTFTNAGSVGIAGLILNVYLASDYDNNSRSILAQTTTNAAGNWVSSLNLNSGTYYLIANTQGDGYQAQQIKIVVP